MMSLTFGLCTQVSDSGPQGPLALPLTQDSHSMTISNIYPYTKATGPIVTKFYIELPWAKGTKLCSNSPGHTINMLAMPAHEKNI